MREWNRRKSEAVWNCRGGAGAIWYLAYASVAQLVEQVTLNHRVLGSSPSRGNILDVSGRLSLKGRRAFCGEGRGLSQSPSGGTVLV